MRRLAWILALVLLLSACGNDDRESRGRIFRFVEENAQALEQRVQEGYFGDLGGPVREVLVREDHVEFVCGGAGFGPETAYRGFFYTETDDVYAIWCAPPRGAFAETEGAWTWREPDGDNCCYVEHICGHFYYYDASF